MRLCVLLGFTLWSAQVHAQPITDSAAPPAATSSHVSSHGWLLGALGVTVAIGGGIALGLGLSAQSRALTPAAQSSATSNITGGALLLGTAVCLFALAVVAWLWRDVPPSGKALQ